MDDLKEEISNMCDIGNKLITLFQSLDNNIDYDFINYIVGEIANNGYCDEEYCYNFILKEE